MKKLHAQIRQDLHSFVEQREKKPWRNWQIDSVFYKPEIESKDIPISDLNRDIESNINQFEFIYPKNMQLLQIEIPAYNKLNRSMLQFCVSKFESKRWLVQWQLRKDKQII